jgi:predicted sugar kinase
VGTHGFFQGGLIVDAGKFPGESLGRLDRHLALPEEWRFVLVRDVTAVGLFGNAESNAFSRLPPVPDAVTENLWRIVREEMLPAVETANSQRFGESVFRYGRLAGRCFANVQGSPFASSAIMELVNSIREFGIAGVGQSSWGPTVFAITATQGEAEDLGLWLSARTRDLEVRIAGPWNRQARI